MKAVPLLIALVGAPGSGRRTIANHLKRAHGVAVTALQQPLYDAVQCLYGVSPAELLFGDPQHVLERVGRSSACLLEELRSHARAVAGPDILIRRLVERTAARGEWLQQDLVITDVQTPAEVHWLRLMRGHVWWVKRQPVSGPPSTETLGLLFDRKADQLIVNDGAPDDLARLVDRALAPLREEAAALG